MLPEVTNSDWLSILVQIIGLFLFIIAFFYFAGYTFFSITKLFSAPFNDLLSEKVEETSNDQFQPAEGSVSHFLNALFPTILEEVKKLALIISGFAILYIATLLPLLQLIAIPLLMVYSVLVVAIDFLDYPMARRQMNISAKIQMVKRFMPELLGFGTITFALFLIPLFGLIILQLAVIGATLLFIQFEKEKVY
jgi:CysZ protein